MSKFEKFLALSLLMAAAPLYSAESDDSLRAEVQAIRQAYEGRISALEAELTRMKSGTLQRQKSADQRIEEALAKDSGGSKSAGRMLTLPETQAVGAATKINIGGYTEFTYVDRGDRIAEFDQLRTVAELSARIHDRIRLYIELEHEHGAIIAGGEETGGELELEQAWIDYEVNKALSFRAGMILVPVGRYNLYHEGHVNNLVDRPLVDRRIIGTTWFEEGLGFHGTPLDTDWLGLSYEAYIFNPAAAEGVSSGGGFRGIRREGTSPTNDKKAGAARVAIEPARSAKWFADYLELGLSGYISGFDGFKGENEDGDVLSLHDGHIHIAAVDFTYEKWNFGVRGEAAFAHADKGANSTEREQDGWGGYVEGYVKFWPKFLSPSPFGRSFKDPKLVFAVRYDRVDLNVDSLDQRDLSRFTAGIGYRPVPSTVFKFDYQVDHSPSSRAGTGLGESGDGKNTDAFLFSVATGF